MKYIAFLVILISTLAFAIDEPFVAPGTIDREPGATEKTPTNGIKSRIECDKNKGQWIEYRESGFSICIVPYPDAGKLCKNSNDCIGHCIWPLDNKTLNGKDLQKGFGACQINDDPDDCGRPHFEDGKIVYFKCD